MKSRTSFCNPTILRKDVTRFAPVWGCYALFVMLVMTSFLSLNTHYHRALNAADLIAPAAVINLIYAFVVMQLLFGDLYNSRMCNTLHALPLRRETWFGSHLTAALLFSLIPNLAAALIAIPFMGQSWMIPLYWLAASTMQYIFFLGTAVVSAMVVGNRFAMLAVYVLINFLSLLFYWFAATIYEPMMYGVQFSDNIYILLSPCTQMTQFNNMVDVRLFNQAVPMTADGATVAYVSAMNDTQQFTVGLGFGWGYHAICAGLGVGLMVLALELYRRRKLESAGDFIAIRALEPLFLTLFTLGVGAFFQLCAELFGLSIRMLFLASGLVVGYYGGRMLMMRTTRVFQPKALTGIIAIALVLAGSIGLMKMDAFGIVRRIPEASKVTSVTISENNYISRYSSVYTFDNPVDIEAVTQLHQDVLDSRGTSDDFGYYTSVFISYTLSDGSTLERWYTDVAPESVAGRKLHDYYTQPEYVLGVTPDQYGRVADSITYFWFESERAVSEELENYDFQGLLQAVAADCRAGNMAQDSCFHIDEYRVGWLELEYRLGNDYNQYLSLSIFSTCENTIAWLEDNGFTLDYSEYNLIGG